MTPPQNAGWPVDIYTSHGLLSVLLRAGKKTVRTPAKCEINPSNPSNPSRSQLLSAVQGRIVATQQAAQGNMTSTPAQASSEDPELCGVHDDEILGEDSMTENRTKAYRDVLFTPVPSFPCHDS